MAIGEWDDNRNASHFQHFIEHEEFNQHSANLFRLINGYDHQASGLWISGNEYTWTSTSWDRPNSDYRENRQYEWLRDGIAWSKIGVSVWVSAVSGTGYLRCHVWKGCYPDEVVSVGYIPDTTGVSFVAGTAWVELSAGVEALTTLGMVADFMYALQLEGKVANPGDSFTVRLWMAWLTHRDET